MIVSIEKKRLQVSPKPDLWPDDYCQLDGGRLFVRRDFADIFIARGWDQCEKIMCSTECTVVRTIEQRDNCLVGLPAPDGGTVRAYLKRHWTTVKGDADDTFMSPGMEEAEAVGRCQSAGVNTMSIIAAGQRRTDEGNIESFFMSEEIQGGLPADKFWQRRMGRPGDRRATDEERRMLLAALADTARLFHRANLFHRDFYWCHFFVTESQPNKFDVRLIDLQRVLQPRYLRWRWLLKDLAQFRFSIPSGQVTDDEMQYWFACYLGDRRQSIADRLGQALIAGRAALYRWRENRHGETKRKPT